MKKELKILVLLILLFFTNICKSQDKTDAKIDFISKSINYEEAKKGDKNYLLLYKKWILSEKDIKEILKLSKPISSAEFHDLYMVMPCKYKAKIIKNDNEFYLEINSGSFIIIKEGASVIKLGCNSDGCKKYFIFPPQGAEKDEMVINKRFKKIYDSVSASKEINKKWFGIYSTTINANSKDWKGMQDITIRISTDSIIFKAAGYQIDQQYKLIATKSNKHTLKLEYQIALDNTESAVLEKTKDFGTITYDGKKYVWTSPYIDFSFGDNKKKAYILTKK